jgi:hypothetical protein
MKTGRILMVSAVLGYLFSMGPAAFAQSGVSGPAGLETALKESTETLKQSALALIDQQEKELQSATANLEQLRTLAADGLVARNEVEHAQELVNTIQQKQEVSRHQVSEANQLIIERGNAQLAASTKASAPLVKPLGNYSSSGNIVRYTTPTLWTPSGLGLIQGFYKSKFGRTLPVSALGQSSTHNSMGYDHRNAVDVALHPDSVGGRALIEYLRSMGIPFLAFRTAIPGVATGPHIHIGQPSHKD